MSAATVYDDTMMPEGVTFLDDVPERGNPQTVPDLRCLTCGTPLEYGGRGRKPKYCDEHKPTTHNAGGTGRTPNKAIVDRAVSQLELAYQLTGSGLLFVAPVAGRHVVQRAAPLSESWRSMLEVNKKLRDFFLKVEKGAAWLPIVMAHGDLALAVIAEIQYNAAQQRPSQQEPYEDVQGFTGTIFDADPVGFGV